jgi:hypothetical protein
VQSGIQVLITNPSLVETGLDLNDFTTLYYYNISYNLFTLRQASRRSWRINQRAPRIEVYFAYYEGTMQHRAIRLMASKLAVAGIIEGNFTDEGLAAMSDCADLTTALARELSEGIKDEVEDLGAVFKKMAILKPVSTTEQFEVESDVIDSTAIVVEEYPVICEPADPVADLWEEPAQSAEEIESFSPSSRLLSLAYKPRVARKPRKKPVILGLEGQLTLFDVIGETA